VAVAPLGQGREPAGDLGDGEVEAVPAVGERGHPGQGGVAVAAEHNRDAAVADRLGVDPD
jgi:hypothetical protein